MGGGVADKKKQNNMPDLEGGGATAEKQASTRPVEAYGAKVVSLLVLLLLQNDPPTERATLTTGHYVLC